MSSVDSAPLVGARLAANIGVRPEGKPMPALAQAIAAPVPFDEMSGTDGAIRAAYAELKGWLDETEAEVLAHRRREAELLFRRIGITFAVYGESEAQERLIPFDRGGRGHA